MLDPWLEARGIEVVLTTLVLAAARPLAFVMATPLFTRFGLQEGVLRGGIVVAFAMPVAPGLMAELNAMEPIAPAALLVLILKELLLGLALGLVLGVPFWAVSAAGNIVDMQRGAMMASYVDPGSGTDTTPTGTLLFLIAAILLASSGWFRDVLLDTLYTSFAVWPAAEPWPALEPAAGAAMLGLLADLTETGVVLALPLFGPLLTAEIAIALATKYTRQINAMFLSMSVKQVIFIITLPLYYGALVYYLKGEVADLADTIERVEGFIRPPGGRG